MILIDNKNKDYNFKKCKMKVVSSSLENSRICNLYSSKKTWYFLKIFRQSQDQIALNNINKILKIYIKIELHINKIILLIKWEEKIKIKWILLIIHRTKNKAIVKWIIHKIIQSIWWCLTFKIHRIIWPLVYHHNSNHKFLNKKLVKTLNGINKIYLNII